jgi:hypothetical protein
MTKSPRSNKEQVFWQWFLQNEDMLLRHPHTDEDREDVLDLVQRALKKVDEHLAFEFGPPDIRREFIVSAGGIKSSFHAVLGLQQNQPSLEQWLVTYFQPRRHPICTIELDGVTINSRDIEFSILSRDNDIGLEVFIPGYRETDLRRKQIGYLFLDQALGEFDVATKIPYLRFFAPTDPVIFDRIPFEELPKKFDEVYDRLNALSGKPS